MTDRADLTSPARALVQSVAGMVGVFSLALIRGYSNWSATLAAGAAALTAAAGWLAYYERVPVLGRYVSPGPPRTGRAAAVISSVCLVLMLTGVVLVIWVVLAIGRA